MPVLGLFAAAAFAPLPFVIAQPGLTADVLGARDGKPVISVTGTPTRQTTGQLRMTTIQATGPSTTVKLPELLDDWFDSSRAVMPKEAVYPSGGSDKEIEAHNLEQMAKSQSTATQAALGHLHKDPKDVKVELNLADVGGPSAGLLFSLGIVDKIDGDGSGGDLTGGRTIAGTGTISEDGKVGAVGGVALKTQAAQRDGASVFLVPEAECSDARSELPEGLRLIPVTTLTDAVQALRALNRGSRFRPADPGRFRGGLRRRFRGGFRRPLHRAPGGEDQRCERGQQVRAAEQQQRAPHPEPVGQQARREPAQRHGQLTARHRHTRDAAAQLVRDPLVDHGGQDRVEDARAEPGQGHRHRERQRGVGEGGHGVPGRTAQQEGGRVDGPAGKRSPHAP